MIKKKFLFFCLIFITAFLFSCKKTTEDFFDAIGHGDLKTIEACIKQGMDINTDINGYTTVMEAAEFGSLESLKFLLEHEGDPTAIVNTTSSSSKLLLKQTTKQALTYAIPDIKKMQLLFDYGVDPNNFGDSEVSPLMVTIQRLYVHRHNEESLSVIYDSIRLLLEYGADPNYRGPNSGMSALLVALNYENRKAVDLLLEYGAVPQADPVKVVFRYDPLNFKEWDEDYGVVWQSELHMFAYNGYADLLMPYIESGQISPDLADPDGLDFYYYAVNGGHPDMVARLLPYLKDINAKRYDDGYTDMSLLFAAALLEDSTEIVQMLLDKGINPNLIAKDRWGHWRTAMDECRDYDSQNIIANFKGSRYASSLPGYEENEERIRARSDAEYQASLESGS